MRAAVWYGKKDIRIEDVSRPTVGPGEVLIKVKAAGLCGTELHAYEGVSRRRRPPLIMGHEFAGVVEEVGTGARGVAIGDRVAVNPAVPCGACDECQSGRPNICRVRQHVGVDFPGAFAEYAKVPDRVCFKIPDEIPFKEATLAEPLSIGTHTAALAEATDKDILLILGSGPIGLSCLIALRDTAKMTIVADTLDSRLKFAKMLGADVTIDASRTDIASEVRYLTSGKCADIAIEAVGLEKTVGQSIASVGNAGRVVIVGLLDETARINLLDIVLRQIELKGSYGRTNEEFLRALGLLKRDLHNIGRLITHTYSLDQVSEAFETMSRDKRTAMKIVVIP